MEVRTYLTGEGGGLRRVTLTLGFVQTSLLFMFLVSFKFLSALGFRVGGKMVSGSFGAGDFADFFTICRMTLELFESVFLAFSLVGLSPPGSGVVGVAGLLLCGRSGSAGNLSICKPADLVRSTVLFNFGLLVESANGTKKEKISSRVSFLCFCSLNEILIDYLLLPVLGLFLVTGLVSALPILIVFSTVFEDEGVTALLR